MKLKVINKYKIDANITDLMIESEDPMNPNPEHNAYNWGLAHAQLILSGADPKVIKELQPK
jgi:hypothetical protein